MKYGLTKLKFKLFLELFQFTIFQNIQYIQIKKCKIILYKLYINIYKK